ncbi:hypothetical protein [Aneurinibacillus uraniidurans]|uniref:hypothetical protein n=1 Tax=Aneurinibacillus uraniidurans TaxID=2966586 RepID=UPI00234B01FF|nr:hypothetical protein [Aneurinibacillus sp. B1]WCN38806.1 hypothetical protein PO771_05240 [Aneurinibacillus sp. B1]
MKEQFYGGENEMETWKYSTTADYFDLLDFHDALVEKIEVNKGEITVDIESINILPHHPLNPFDVAKNTDKCRLVFVEPIKNEAIYFNNDNIPQRIECTNFKELEIMKFDCKQHFEYYLYEIFGSANGFCEWKVVAKGFYLYWNDFVADAWFVNWNKDT